MKHSWRKAVAIFIACLVIGNAIITLVLYAIGQPHKTAWTGFIPQSTPSAVNDLLLAVIVLTFALWFWRHE